MRARLAPALLSVLGALLLFPALAPAQGAGRLEITVIDPSGFVMPGASVQLVGTEIQARTDEAGRAHLANLAPGSYTVRASAESLQAVTQPDVQVSAGRTTSIAMLFVLVRSRETQVDVIGEEAAVLRQVPGSVELLSRDQLRASYTVDANEVLRRVPGLTVREDSGPAGMRLNIGIRGLNPDRSRQVLVLEDGLPLALAPYGEPEMYYSPPIERMQRIEVIKGSGSILFGPQTIGGVVNFVTPDPPSRPQGTLDLTGGQYGLFVGQATAGTSWNRFGLLVSGLRKQANGFRSLEYRIHDLTTKATYTLSRRQSLGLKGNLYEEDSNSTYLGLTQPLFDTDPNANPVPNDTLRVARLFGSIHHRLVVSDRMLLTTTAFAYDTQRFWRRQDYDRQFNPARQYTRVFGDPSQPGGAVFLRSSSGSRDREFRVAGLESRLMRDHSLFGVGQAFEGGGRVLYERARDRFVNWSDVTGGSDELRDNERRPAHALSLFAQNRIALGSRATLTPGVRLEDFEYTRHIMRTRVNGIPAPVEIRATDRLFEVVPGIGGTFQPIGEVTFFAGAHRGFSPPRVKDAISSRGESLQLEAERSWNYESGVRWNPRSGIRTDATVFVLDFSNQIIPAAQSGGATTTLINAGRTRHQGLEVSTGVDLRALLGRPTGILTELRYTWLPTARFTSSIYAGNRLPYAPRHSANLLVAFRDLNGLNVQVDGTFIGHQFGDNEETVAGSIDGTIGRLPAYGLWNVSADYQVRRGRIHVAPFVAMKNAANRLYIASRAPEGIQPGPFRQINVGLRTAF
jgi:Fe(3+) dicitrate transport protein